MHKVLCRLSGLLASHTEVQALPGHRSGAPSLPIVAYQRHRLLFEGLDGVITPMTTPGRVRSEAAGDPASGVMLRSPVAAVAKRPGRTEVCGCVAEMSTKKFKLKGLFRRIVGASSRSRLSVTRQRLGTPLTIAPLQRPAALRRPYKAGKLSGTISGTNTLLHILFAASLLVSCQAW